MITVIGWDGSPLGEQAAEILAGATLVVGGKRHLAALPVPGSARVVELGSLLRGVRELAEHARDGGAGDAVVIASGDPGFFGIVRALRQAGLAPRVLPALSSVAVAVARFGLTWDDAGVVSAHGRGLEPAVNVCRSAAKVAVLTAPGAGPAELGEALAGTGRRFAVGTDLGTEDEELDECTPEQAAARHWRDPNVVLVLDAPVETVSGQARQIAGPTPAPDGWALPEDDFAHRDSMVTKAEVRALVLARLGPGLGRCVWDVGAGSGSVAVECARFGAAAVAIERDADACGRIEQNAATHGVRVQVVRGVAPKALAGLPDPDAVFVGGGGAAALRAVLARRPGRVVAAYASLEHAVAARTALAKADYAPDGVQLAASRFAELPDGTARLAATNPVFVLWGSRPDVGTTTQESRTS